MMCSAHLFFIRGFPPPGGEFKNKTTKNEVLGMLHYVTSWSRPAVCQITQHLVLQILFWSTFIPFYSLQLLFSPTTELIVLTVCGLRSTEADLHYWTWFLFRGILQYTASVCWYRWIRPSLNLYVWTALQIPSPRIYSRDVRYWATSSLHTTWTLRVALSPKPVTKRGKHRCRRHYGTYSKLHAPRAHDQRQRPKWNHDFWTWVDEADWINLSDQANWTVTERNPGRPGKERFKAEFTAIMDQLRGEADSPDEVDGLLQAFPPLDQLANERALRHGFLKGINRGTPLISLYNATKELLKDTHIKLNPSAESQAYIEQHTAQNDLPIVFDTGCSCSLTPVLSDFTSTLDDTPAKEMNGHR